MKTLIVLFAGLQVMMGATTAWSAPHSSSTHALTLEDCAVAVCDVAAKIEELKALNGNERYNFYSALNKEHKKTQDPAILKNLKEFGRAAKALSKSMEDEDWVIREAGYLLDLGVIGSIKYVAESADQMIDDYREISNSQGRWAALTFWSNQISEIEDLERLKMLVTFGEAAQSHSRMLGDDEYLPREARAIVTQSSSRMVALYPIHEGVYDIALDCGALVGTGNALCATEYPINRAVVINLGSDQGLIVNFLNRDLGIVKFRFERVIVERSGQRMKGFSGGSATPAEFVLELNPETREVQGRLSSIRSSTVATITGKSVATPASLYAVRGVEATYDPSQLQGRYEGKFGDLVGTLDLHWITPYNEAPYFGAVFTERETGVQIEFQRGEYIKTRGILNLIYTTGQSGMAQKWSMVILNDSNSVLKISGISFSSITGSLNDVSFTRIGDAR